MWCSSCWQGCAHWCAHFCEPRCDEPFLRSQSCAIVAVHCRKTPGREVSSWNPPLSGWSNPAQWSSSMAHNTPAQHFLLANLSPLRATTTALLSSRQTAGAQSHIDFKLGSSHCDSSASESSSLASSCLRKQFGKRQVSVSNHLMWAPRHREKCRKWFTSYSCWHSSS